MRRLFKSIYLKVPTYDELRFTKMLLSDPDTMKFNEKWGGTVPFPKEKWKDFYENYILNTERHYFHVYNIEGVFVGEVSSRYDNEFNSYILNIKIMHRYRGNNHAKDALECFLSYMFEEVGIDSIKDNVGHDSTAGIKLLTSFGFQEIDRTDEYVLLELKSENF